MTAIPAKITLYNLFKVTSGDYQWQQFRKNNYTNIKLQRYWKVNYHSSYRVLTVGYQDFVNVNTILWSCKHDPALKMTFCEIVDIKILHLHINFPSKMIFSATTNNAYHLWHCDPLYTYVDSIGPGIIHIWKQSCW